MATIYSHAAFRRTDEAAAKRGHQQAHLSALQWIGILAMTSWLVIGGMAGVFYTVVY